MSPNSIGEVLITCAFAKSLIEKSGYPITLCVRPEHKPMVDTLYPNRFTAVVAMDMELMRSFSTTGFIPKGHFDIDFPVNLSPLHYYENERLLSLHNLIYKRQGGSGLTLTDTWRYMLQLDWDAPMERPCRDFLEKDNPTFKGLGDITKNYVFFKPGNNTNKPTPAAFWNELERQYQASQQKMLVNIKGSMLVDKSLKFTNKVTQVNLDILDALYFMHKAKSTISGNSGLTLIEAFMDYPKNHTSHINIIATDQYCEHYHLLNTDWEKAFLPFDGIPSTHIGVPEMLNGSSHVSLWNISSNLEEADYRKAAKDLFSKNIRSEFYIKANLTGETGTMPKPVVFDKGFSWC